ncbi:hypothetical protein [Actinomycetospora succinea]|uniref:hypothetical protein n=1 Tax=Actinomycetospora succinea TaxID=663603 RepID=UPI00105BC0E6|nr:hypothetical protein [Actinomycetospora succinea]
MRAPADRHDTVGVTPPGVRLAGARRGHARPRSRVLAVARGTAAALLVFLLALLMVTGIEVVAGQPLSGGHAGQTSLGQVLHPTR